MPPFRCPSSQTFSDDSKKGLSKDELPGNLAQESCQGISVITGIDLFCGAGGSSIGARRAGVEMVGAVDGWDVATRTYADNFPMAKRNVITARLDDESGQFLFDRVGKIDLIIASPECTHHSIARGAKLRCEESRRSGWYVMPFVDALRPRWVVLENVTPMRNWAGFDELMTALKSDYHVRLQTLNACDFGVPQSRRRLFVICDRRRMPDEVIPLVGEQRTAADVLDPQGTWTAGLLRRPGRAAATLARADAAIEKLGPGKDFIVVYYGSDRAGGWQPLNRPLRTLTTLDRFGLVQWQDGEPTFRMLQVPEIQRAMGVEDMILNQGSRRDRIKLLGNGVCAPVMEHVIRSLMTSELGIRKAA
ncbi:DNA cytosine methyltransferase [Labrys sp. ZIDIC5]|uniref:DNA cytosine methyltransferase n=1 Tax=Labrys sedimenti TaxID=3106036 RepID=UPI002ACAD9CA|nr:DNA cytosine methyltransferase [Labrys sp. ZIDIC5]MDZ5454434.1 DNA cytosine methyltransferase [Labrys sp. ZIDIC5]